MSVRVYRGGYARFRRRRYPTILSWTTTILAIVTQMVYPLMPDNRLLSLTFFVVATFALAGLVQAWCTHGTKYAATWFVATALFGFIVEEIGVHSGWPFGEYAYSDSLGPAIGGVPIVVPLAWAMLSHPILVLSRRISRRWAPLVFGWTIMAWDLFLDPLMVDAGRWTWNSESRDIPFITGIPLSNAAGWLLCGVALGAILHWGLPREHRKSAPSSAAGDVILGWTLFSGVIGNLFFFDRPGTALVGGLALGITLVPYFFMIWITRE
ncbi:unannotated protein [freshwater metagenome]|uniref:Unannotated protein n=1 Tax=freshwater metagenome TaxID=449393 RepID=A0A6J7BLD5_9ZZZZ|nr:carotenoid biosynthesis protein [Actinomycetota bacterium]